MLRPVIDGEYWSGPDTITVEPQQSKNYELTYRPLTMTQEGKKHMVRNTAEWLIFSARVISQVGFDSGQRGLLEEISRYSRC